MSNETEHTGRENLEHFLSYNCASICDENADELRRIIDQCEKEAQQNVEVAVRSASDNKQSTLCDHRFSVPQDDIVICKVCRNSYTCF